MIAVSSPMGEPSSVAAEGSTNTTSGSEDIIEASVDVSLHIASDFLTFSCRPSSAAAEHTASRSVWITALFPPRVTSSRYHKTNSDFKLEQRLWMDGQTEKKRPKGISLLHTFRR